MENNKELVVEVVHGAIHNRNKIKTLTEYNKLSDKNAWKSEMYRSYYVFDETFDSFVRKNKSVKGYNGLIYLDRIIIDLDKGEIENENMQTYLRHSCDELINFGIDDRHINTWFSGSGYHIELLNIFGFQPNKKLHEKVKATLSDCFSFGDNIYDKTRIIRSNWSLNKKTNLYKIWIPLQYVWDLSYDEITKIASSKRAYNKFSNSKPNFYNTLNSHGEVEPYLQNRILSVQNNYTNGNNNPIRSGETSSVVTCVQHIFNEGPSQGSRVMKMMRMISSYKRAGIPYLVALNGMRTWANGELKDHEVSRTVTSVYDNHYMYGCQDKILSDYCDPKCIYFKRKDYLLDIKDVESLEDTFKQYVTHDFSKKSINMKDIFNTSMDYMLKPGELVIFSGDTGVGKTAFVQNIVTKAKKDTLFLSLEMNEVLTFRRFVQIAMNKTKEWVYSVYKGNKETSFSEELKHIRIMTIAPEIEAIKKVVAEYEPNVLVIDTTDELQVDRYSGDIQKQNIIIDTLKGIAQRNNTLILAVHHVNKISAAQGTIGLHSLKGSSNVVQKADKVIVVKGNRKDRMRTIVSEKSRDEGDLELLLFFNDQTMRFEKMEI